MTELATIRVVVRPGEGNLSENVIIEEIDLQPRPPRPRGSDRPAEADNVSITSGSFTANGESSGESTPQLEVNRNSRSSLVRWKRSARSSSPPVEHSAEASMQMKGNFRVRRRIEQ